MSSGGNAFQWPDYVVFSCVLATSVAIGLYHSLYAAKKKPNTSVEYLLGGRQMSWLPVGLSILVTFQSAVLYTGVPTEVYIYGISFYLFVIGIILAVIICTILFVPLLYPLKMTSTYEYLELRYKSKATRLLGFVLGSLSMAMFMGVTTFAPAIAIESACGIPVWAAIILLGGVTIIYTVLGGLKAVVWNDVFQFIIMLTGLLVMFIKGCMMVGGLGKVFDISRQGGRLDLASFDPNPRTRHTVWGLVLGATFVWLANIGVNQNNVQRMSSVPTMKAAKLTILTSIPGYILLTFFAQILGLIVYAYNVTVQCDPLKAGLINNPNQFVAFFVAVNLGDIPGISGLFISSLCAAALSTLSSNINSLAALAWEDVFKLQFKNVSEEKATFIIKFLSVCFGVLAIILALIVSMVGGSATQIIVTFMGSVGGPLLGMYLLGCFFPWANWIGAFSGGLTALAFCLWLAIGGFTIPPEPMLPLAPVLGCPSRGIGVNNTVNGSVGMVGYNISTVDMGQMMYDHGLNDTVSTLLPNEEQTQGGGVLYEFYRISYLWYSAIGVFLVIVIGLIVSFITGKTDPRDIDPRLVVPFFDRFCCCLPKHLRVILQCGVPFWKIDEAKKVRSEEEMEVVVGRNLTNKCEENMACDIY